MCKEKPIVQIIEENITSTFNEKICTELSNTQNESNKEALSFIIGLAYKEGLIDGLKIAFWLSE